MRILLLSLLSLFSSVAIAAFSENTSDKYGPPGTSTMIKCPQIKVNNDILTKDPAQKITDLGGVECHDQAGGGGAWGGSVIGLGFGGVCPNIYPYLGGFTEVWTGHLWYGGGIGMTISCCSLPQPPMSVKSDSTTWVEGTICP